MSLLVYRAFGGRRGKPLITKVVRDGELMYDHARHVIVIDKQGRVTENFENHRPHLVNCLVVLGPVVYEKKQVSQAVLLEIGFKRFVPYAQAEYLVGKRVVAIKPRSPVARLSDETTFALLPEIKNGIQRVVDNSIMAWKKTLPIRTLVSRSKDVMGKKTDHVFYAVSRIFVKVPIEEPLLCAAMLLAEREWRGGAGMHFDTLAKSTKGKLKDYLLLSGTRDVNRLTDEQIKKANMCYVIADMFKIRVRYRGYKQYAMETILRGIGSVNSPERILLERIFKLFKVPEAPVEHLPFKLDSTQSSRVLKLLKGLSCYRSARHESKRKKHSTNSIVFTVLGSMDKMEKMMAERMLAKTTSSEAETLLEDDDIPF
jgi:hypothetical protein